MAHSMARNKHMNTTFLIGASESCFVFTDKPTEKTSFFAICEYPNFT